MEVLKLALGERSYDIQIAKGFNDLPSALSKAIPNSQFMIVSNEVVAPLYLEALIEALPKVAIRTCILQDGEEHKNLAAIDRVISALLENRFDRQCTLVALGGGVVGDITGFAAASYQRGVNFVQVPTTLLAQVDSSVGGKTGVNHPLGKNMIGAFHQPRLVFANIDTLKTLPPRELRAGIAEVIKYGLISRPDFFAWLEDHLEELLKCDPDAVAQAIRISCETKADVVAQDEKESGIRAILNLGHTFGHAIETALGYGEWLHGEAVGCGMCLAAKMSYLAGWLSEHDMARTYRLIERAGLPVKLPASISVDEMLSHMRVDKKNRDGKIRLVLLKQLGEAIITDDFEPALLEQVLSNRD